MNELSSTMSKGSSSSYFDSNFRSIGDALNYAGILTNMLVTTAAMAGSTIMPRDDGWLSNGFCVDKNPGRVIDTEITCFVLLTGSALALYFFNASSRHDERRKMNPQLQAKMDAGLFANFSHGFGHLFLLFMDGAPPPIEFIVTPAAIGNIIMLFAFWTGVLKAVAISLNTKQAAVGATAVLATQYALGVPPGLAFTYSQSIILLAGAVDQLLLPRDQKGVTYVIVAASYAPLFVLFIAEMTQCTDMLAQFGGHALYDAYLALLPFLLYYVVQVYDEQGQKKKSKVV